MEMTRKQFSRLMEMVKHILFAVYENGMKPFNTALFFKVYFLRNKYY